jgi:hypothetical protein
LLLLLLLLLGNTVPVPFLVEEEDFLLADPMGTDVDGTVDGQNLHSSVICNPTYKMTRHISRHLGDQKFRFGVIF